MKVGVVHAEAQATGVDADAQAMALREIMDRDDRRGEARRRANAERPARAEPVGQLPQRRGGAEVVHRQRLDRLVGRSVASE